VLKARTTPLVFLVALVAVVEMAQVLMLVGLAIHQAHLRHKETMAALMQPLPIFMVAAVVGVRVL